MSGWYPIDGKKRSDDSAVHLQDWDPETGEQIILVDSSLAQDCDLNVLVERFLSQGLDLPMAPDLQYGDDTARPRYEQAKKLILESEQWFDSLPAKVRSRFENNVGVLLDFLQDPENEEEAKRLGFSRNPPQSAPSEEQVEQPKEAAENVPPSST